jgi:PAS domain S-box-containing protein
MAIDLPDEARKGRRSNLRLIAAAAFLLLIAAAGVVLALRFVEQERARDLRQWQVRLGIVADSRAAAVTDWLDRQADTVGGLAQNASLQLYMTELSLAGGDRTKVTEEAAQAGYLRNLLIVTAERTGFVAAQPATPVNANIQRRGVAGLAVIDANGRAIIASHDMPPLDGRLREFVAGARAGERAVSEMFVGAGGRPTMAFLAPIFAVQADPGSRQIGIVLGVKEVDAELFPLLARPPTTEKSAETVLVRKAGAVIEFLSPLIDGTAALNKRLAADTPGLAEAQAIERPGGFFQLRDHRDVAVLATSRAIAAAGWTLVHKIDRREALAASDARLDRMLVALVLAILVGLAVLVAVWRHGASRRAADAARRYAAVAQKLEGQERLLRLVTDSQPAAMFILDAETKLRFANRVMAERCGMSASDLAGKTLAAVIGVAEAKRYERRVRDALESGTSQLALHRSEEAGKVRIVRTEHVPLAQTDSTRSVLVVEQDITPAVVERERRERTQQQLVKTLVAVVDRRDPYAAHHSQRVAQVARRVAEEMGLDPVLADTAETAGNLMNLGKILVSEQLLTRSGDLSDAEKRMIRESIQLGADLLEGVEFDGPVVPTLRQAQERWDGAGPLGIKGDDILVTARVVALANFFVALVSPRAHRPGVELDQAVDTIFRQSGHAFDRRVVAAFLNDLDNHGGRARWASFSQAPVVPPRPASI